MKIEKKIAVVMLLVVFAAGWSVGQVGPAPGPVDPAAESGEQILTPEDLQFLAEARKRRLAVERDQVAAEIRSGLLFDPNKTAAAVAALSDKPAETWADNAERICRAFAMVDARFGKAWAHLRRGDHKAAAAAFKPLISERDTTYLAAAKRFCYAEALAGRGPNEDAVDVYTDLVKAMPDRFSFSALALLRAAQTYEKLHRYYYAMTLYNLWVDSFGLLDAENARKFSERAEKINADYKDPLATLAGRMTEIEKRLATIDSGRLTQQKQREIVSMLDDLIATAEENASQSQSKSQSKSKKQGKKPGQGGKKPGKKPGQGKQGPPSGINMPTQGALTSALVGGNTLQPEGASEVRPSDSSDDWGQLAPRERQKLLETFRETMPERYRGLIRDYYKKLASEASR